MLKYKLHVQSQTNEMKEIIYDTLHFSPDRLSLSGVTNASYGLSSMSTIYLENDSLQECLLMAEDKLRCGYVIYNKSYKVESFEDDAIKGILYVDGQYYCVKTDVNLYENGKNPTLYINHREYEIGQWVGDTIEWETELSIPTKYWSYDNKIEIDGYVYDVIIDNKNSLNNDEEYYPYIILVNGDILYVIDWEYSKRELVTRFTITSQFNSMLKVHFSEIEESNKYIDLYVDKIPSEININNHIKVSNIGFEINEIDVVIENDKASFTIDDKEYIKDIITQRFKEFGIQLYQVHNKEGYSYIIKDSVPIKVTDGGIVEKNFITLNGKMYEIINNKIRYENNINYELDILYVIDNNVLRCVANDKDIAKSLYDGINNKLYQYYFEIVYPLFDKSYVSPLTQSEKDYEKSDFKLYINYLSHTLPLQLSTQVASNLHQDYILGEHYFSEKKNESINRIVDMEKDIYYPARYERSGTNELLQLCSEIQIDLHFRSRDLNTWVVNDSNNIDEYGNKYPSYWNLFDNYRYSSDFSSIKKTQPILTLKNDLQYFPPSDLLYFLNFTNEDIEKKKQKISRSFLRLSFFDSPNPNSQNLLYSTVVYMSVDDLYAKYTNVDKTETDYITLKDRKVEKDIIRGKEYVVDTLDKVKRIGVATEPCKGNVLTFDENKRLSCNFTIKNRYESKNSAEGFYLYLFKEFSNNLHERSIYLKVEFNHAGTGKKINFMNMYNVNTLGEKSMINWATKHNYDKFKEGYALNKLVEHLYVEIKVKYDTLNKCFCYYLPEWMSEPNNNKKIMRLSLFEVKIQDEGDESNT